MTFIKPGHKVKFINDKFKDESSNPFKSIQLNKPIKGEIYTVRDVVETEYGVGLRLLEIINSKFYHDDVGWQEPTFSADRFEK
mgnify:FL=1